ncbi:uncharacterized protein LOC117172382 isoform X2 [Belonocnema kinseyi]|uniref:uncharacterized protein LOC117172382 isoform X2 n=1 Tax=Belonocnema kinseyi TaxID=2817044 RepID=UPI00143D169B|nr:uncharacterized protein LOC117172382 isoform X2 [Belonocnema kinseyi]
MLWKWRVGQITIMAQTRILLTFEIAAIQVAQIWNFQCSATLKHQAAKKPSPKTP